MRPSLEQNKTIMNILKENGGQRDGSEVKIPLPEDPGLVPMSTWWLTTICSGDTTPHLAFLDTRYAWAYVQAK